MWGFCVGSLFCYSVLCVLLVLQSYGWGKGIWLLCFGCLPDVLWLLVFCGSSSLCHGLVCSVWLLYSLIIWSCSLAFFKYSDAPVICIQGPPPTTYRDGAMVQWKYFLIVPAVPGKCRGYNIGTLTLVRFSVLWGWGGLRVGCFHQLVPTGWGLYQGSEKWKITIPAPSL